MECIIRTQHVCTYYRGEQIHRTDGPAVTHNDGTEQWFVEDIEITNRIKNRDWTNWTEQDWAKFKIAFC